MTETEFEQNLNGLDLTIFEAIPSQSTDDDKRSLLAVQVAVRELVGKSAGNYSYLEIGSYLGGSIQPHLIDSKCESIWSIDKRPPSQPDERGFEWKYNNNSTARMLEMLKGVAEDVSKVKTIDGDTREIAANRVEDKIDLCFIDGEHTDEAAFADFKFCLTVLKENGAIMFHDSQITYGGIADSLKYLTEKGISHRAYVLPNVLFVVEIGDFPLHQDEKIAAMLAENHKSYLYALQDNDRYRRFANRFPFGTMRRLLLKIRGGNVSD
ncbi:MAG: class I SAM-dependent methyltransferase [Acidobacteria bacterium]|nr:class I SAM-dependent methyltransferase [Acidobacteriota bacterium]